MRGSGFSRFGVSSFQVFDSGLEVRGFRVEGLAVRGFGLGFQVSRWLFGLRVSWFRVLGSRFQVSGEGFRGSRFRVSI